tara:strand:- start:2543 stop:3421 length:879 start_codon:yes stop_codon:yes gene_type:complete
MKQLAIINPENISEEETKNYRFREAARAVVFLDRTTDIVALLHVTKHGYHKLPGGGVEEGEDFKRACERECEEEIGRDIDMEVELGCVVEYRKQNKLRQISYCYLAYAHDKEKSPQFTESEREKGFEVVWKSLDEAIGLLSGEKVVEQTTDYDGKFIQNRDLIFLLEAKKEKRKIVLCFLRKGDSILLILTDYKDKIVWNGVAGYIEDGELAIDAAIREIKEEIGVDVELNNLRRLGTHDPFEIYMVDGWSGNPSPKEESIKEVRWFKKSSLPYNEMHNGNEDWLPKFIKDL